MYHPLEVVEAEPTEAEDVEEVEEDDVGNHVGTKIKIVQHMEQHYQRPEEPRRRYKEQPPEKKTTQNTLTIRTCVSAVDSMCQGGTQVQHAPQCAAKKDIKKDATVRTTRNMQRRATRWG